MVKNGNLITAADVFDDILESPFKTERDRIKYMSKAYANMSIAKAFSTFYGVEISNEILFQTFVLCNHFLLSIGIHHSCVVLLLT